MYKLSIRNRKTMQYLKLKLLSTRHIYKNNIENIYVKKINKVDISKIKVPTLIVYTRLCNLVLFFKMVDH